METEANIKPGKTPKEATANAVTVGSSSVTAGDGFSAPIAEGGKIPEHIAEDTLMAKGFDEEGKVVTVSLSVLKKLHGEKKGAEMYRKIAIAGGFFDPNTEPVGSNYAPDLSLEGMEKTARAKVDAILEGK